MMSDNEDQILLSGKNIAEFGQAGKEIGNIRSAVPELKESAIVGSLLPAETKESSRQSAPVVSKEILGYVQELQDKNIERLAEHAAILPNTDRRNFFRQFYLALIALVLCVICFKPIVGVRLAAHASMAPILTNRQSVEARFAYADYLVSIGKTNEATALYKKLTEQIASKPNNPQFVALVNLKLAQLILATDASGAKKLVDQSLEKLGSPNEKTPQALVETLRSLAASYISQSQAQAAYPLAMAASEFWDTGHTNNSGGNLFADLAELFSEEGKWQLAFDCYEEAYSFSEQWGDTNFNIYRLCHMAVCKVQLNEPKEAVELFERATTMDRKVYGGKLYYTLESMPKMAWCLIKLNKAAEAVSLLNSTMPFLSGEVRNVALEQLAYAYRLQNRNDEVTSILTELEKAGATTSNIRDIKINLAKMKRGEQNTD